jgi:hypothetical protein
MQRTDLLDLNVPKEASLTPTLPLETALAFRSAQAWEASTAKCGEWAPTGGPEKLAALMSQMAYAPANDQVAPFSNDPETCLKAWNAFYCTLWKLLCSWRSAEQDPWRWWSDPHNRALRIGVHEARARIVTSILPVNADGKGAIRSFALFVSAPESLVEFAEILAYITFSQVLLNQERFAFCGFCDAIFRATARRDTYHATICASKDTSNRSKIKRAVRRNYRRILVVCSCLRNYRRKLSSSCFPYRRHSPAVLSSRQAVTNALCNRDLIDVALYQAKSKWYDRCIFAAKAGFGSSERAKLMNQIVNRIQCILEPAEYERVTRRVSQMLEELYIEILLTDSIESKITSSS